MTSKNSADWTIPKAHGIAYGGGQETDLKKYFKNSGKAHGLSPIRYFFVRLRNYFCMINAYWMPSNKIRVALNRWKGVHIAKGAYIGMFVFIDNAYPDFIFIEENAAINAGSMLSAHFNPMIHFRRTFVAKVDPIVIKKGAIVCVRSIINPGVTIGENAVVSAQSVVNKSVEPATIVRGNPAEPIGKVRL